MQRSAASIVAAFTDTSKRGGCAVAAGAAIRNEAVTASARRDGRLHMMDMESLTGGEELQRAYEAIGVGRRERVRASSGF